jgi:hypothetical protein
VHKQVLVTTVTECRNVLAEPRGYSPHLYTNSVAHSFHPSRSVFISPLLCPDSIFSDKSFSLYSIKIIKLNDALEAATAITL